MICKQVTYHKMFTLYWWVVIMAINASSHHFASSEVKDTCNVTLTHTIVTTSKECDVCVSREEGGRVELKPKGFNRS